MTERGIFLPASPFPEFRIPHSEQKTEAHSDTEWSEFNWRANVVDFVQEFPQIINGDLDHFIVGGTAVYIYTDGKTRTRPDLPRRPFPPDIDVVARTKELAKKLKKKSDVRPLGYWIGGRSEFSATREVKKRVMQSVSKKEVLGETVYVASKPALVVTKLTSFVDPETKKFRLPRDKDYLDVILLGVPLDEIKREYELWGGNPNRLYIPDHVAAVLT